MKTQPYPYISLQAREFVTRRQNGRLGPSIERIGPYWYQILLLAVIPVAFWLDARTTSIGQQNILGACAWLLLLLSMRFSRVAERRQVWVMVGVASAVEVWSSIVWGI